MAKEIERKFLVKDMPSITKDNESYLVEQYYISTNPEIRLRKTQNLNSNQVNYYMTQKSDGTKVRDEIETEVDESFYISNQEKMIGHMIRKTRTRIPLENKLTAELDVYHGIDLRVVEVEFKDESEANAFILPQWFGKEVTNDKRYKNKNLAIKGKM
jgi:CYTH domain-containing protein